LVLDIGKQELRYHKLGPTISKRLMVVQDNMQ